MLVSAYILVPLLFEVKARELIGSFPLTNIFSEEGATQALKQLYGVICEFYVDIYIFPVFITE